MITTAPESGQAHEAYKQIADAINLENANLSGNINWARHAATTGTDTVAVTSATFGTGLRRIYIPETVTVTGIAVQVGSVGGTAKLIGTLYDSAGTLLRATAAAGILVGTAVTQQQLPFSLNGSLGAATTITLEPGFYWIGICADAGGTGKLRYVPAGANIGNTLLCGAATQTFGTITTTITPPTAFVAERGTYCSTY